MLSNLCSLHNTLFPLCLLNCFVLPHPFSRIKILSKYNLIHILSNINLGCVCVSRSVLSDFLWPNGLQPSRLLCPWNSPGKNTGVDCHSLFQRVFTTQGLNSGLLHCRQILYHLRYREVLAHLKLLKYRYFQGVQFSSSMITPKGHSKALLN